MQLSVGSHACTHVQRNPLDGKEPLLFVQPRDVTIELAAVFVPLYAAGGMKINLAARVVKRALSGKITYMRFTSTENVSYVFWILICNT